MKFFISRKLLLLPVAIALLTQAYANRETIPLRSDWRFIKEDAGIFADSDSWEKITVPHTWNALDGQDGPAEISDKQESAAEATKAMASKLAALKSVRDQDPHTRRGLYEGACWYERTLAIPSDWEGKKRIFIRFEAASLVAKTYINKTLLGEHRGAFTAFCYELTDYLNY